VCCDPSCSQLSPLYLNACWIGLIPTFTYNVIVSLSVAFFLYYFEYRVVGVDACIVHLYSVISHLIYITSLECVHVLPFLWVFKAFIVSVILPYVCPMFNM
jgi:hypothetical protein